MALGLSQKAMPVHIGLPKPPITSTMSGGDLDFDLLVTRVESTIHEDKQHQRYGMTPQELMRRSNPSLYQADNPPAHRDLANPREVYNILSHKSKSIEDLSAKFKQELARSVQTTGTLPKLSRALSMNDIEHRPDKANRSGYRHDSHGITSNPHRKLNLLALKRHNTSVNETRKTTEHKPVLNLPSIEEKGVRHEEKGDRHEELKARFRQRNELGQLTERTECDDDDIVIKRVEFSDSNNQRIAEEKEQISRHDAKLNKWFSEMPNEVFDKAQRALMEDSIKDRLQDFQKRRRKKHTDFPHSTFHVCVGPKVRKVPNTYLELRVDSFGKHDKDDKMLKYRLQQKSMHNLKMRESADMDQYDRMNREETFPKLIIQNRSLTTMTGTKLRKSDPEPSQIVAPKKEINFRADNRFKTVNINDAIGADFVQNSKPKHGHNNYEEYTERLVMMKELAIDLSNMESHRFNNHGDNTDKDASKAAIVNLTLGQEVPKQKKTHLLEKAIDDTNMDTVLPRVEGEDMKDEDVYEHDETEEEKPKPDKIITKIPTAQSVRTSDTRSSNSSILSKSTKEALKKFNKLEVFAESKPSNDGMPTRDIFSKGKHQTSDEPVTIQSTKSDVKQQKRYVQGNSDAILLQEPRKREPEVMFRFEPGEVFVQRKPAMPLTTSTRCSERARIIYGKTIQGPNDKISSDRQARTNKKNQTNTGNSAMTKSTKLDGFKSEFSRYESRALNESLGTISPRQDDGAKNNSLIVTSSTMDRERSMGLRLTRDVATETDLLGSIHDSKSQVSAEDKQAVFYNQDAQEVRSDSELSDSIVENNDGESLESEEDSIDVVHREIQSTMSV